MEVADRIANAIAEVMRTGYGHGPKTGIGMVTDDMVVVVLEETFSPAEITLIDAGKADDVRAIRRGWQTHMAGDFRQIVEVSTGRTVTAFISDTDVEARVSVEVFLLGESKTDMESFEEADTDATGGEDR